MQPALPAGVTAAPLLPLSPPSNRACDEDARLLGVLLDLPTDRFRVMLEELGGLHGLHRAGPRALGSVLSPRRVRRLEALFELVERLLEPDAPLDAIDGPARVAEYFRPKLLLETTEKFWVLALDVRSRPLLLRCIAQGTLTSCWVHPREVFAPAIAVRAAQIITIHNHPSGDSTPSDEDYVLTRRLVDAGELLGIPLVDHVIVARDGHHSIGPGAL